MWVMLDDVTYAYDDVTYAYDDVTFAYDVTYALATFGVDCGIPS